MIRRGASIGGLDFRRASALLDAEGGVEEGGEGGRAEAGGRVPALEGVEAGRLARAVVPREDVLERGPVLVEEGVEEAERRLARGEARVVEERDDSGEGRRGAGRPRDL